MILMVDGDSEIGAHVESNVGNLICLGHLFSSPAEASLKFICKTGFPFMRETCSELPSNVSNMVQQKL